MKKTVTINISGIAFTIDEDAFDKLSNYLSQIKSFFNKSDGQDEIMADIEARIAEMLQEQLSEIKHVVNIDDIEAVIATMGQPEDYVDGDAEEESAHTNSSSDNTSESTSRNRRLYRDDDGGVVGGVCSGVGYYFGFDPVWLRALFAISIFIFGTGAFLYVVMWMIIPEAKSTSEKLEMKGEPVNVDNIGKSIEEEMNNLKDQLNDLANNGASNLKNKDGFVNKIISFVSSIIQFFLRFAVKFAGIMMICVGVFFLIGLVGSLFGTGTISFIDGNLTMLSLSQIDQFVFSDGDDSWLFYLGLIITAGIPIVSILYGGVKLVLGIKQKIKGVGIGLLVMWIVGIVTLVIASSQLSQEFAEEGYNKTTIMISDSTTSVSDTLNLSISDDLFQLGKRGRRNAHRSVLVKTDDDQLFLGNVSLDIQRADVDYAYIEVYKRSRGRNFKEANASAKAISYDFTRVDNQLIFAPQYTVAKDDKYRFQMIDITLFLPVGQTVFFDKKLDRIIYDIHNTCNMNDRYMPNMLWTMTTRGLTSAECEDEIANEELEEAQEQVEEALERAAEATERAEEATRRAEEALREASNE